MKRWGDIVGLAVFFALLIASTAAKAQSTCNFTTECFETDACQETAFQFDFTKGEDVGTGTAVQASTEFGDFAGYVVNQTPEAATYAFDASGTYYFLTVADREARLSTHMPGPLTVHYQGTCEDLD